MADVEGGTESESLSHRSSDSDLSMHYSSSPFGSDWSSVRSHDTPEPGDRTVEPYLYEPEDITGSDSPSDSSSDESRNDRLGNSDWCECGNCVPMPTPAECVCCKEITAIVNKCESMDSSEPSTLQCIINHEGFDSVCPNVWVLQTAYFNYRHHYGTHDIRDTPTHEQYRFVAYRQFTYWCWGWLGRRVRVTLPSCVVNRIRSTFPSPDGLYTGFKYPSLS